MCCWVVELPALVTAWVSHEHAFLHVWLKRTSLVLLNEDICKTSPNFEMRDTICTFCYSILLWPVASHVASMNSAGISEFDELLGHVVPPFVVLQFLDFRIELVFSGRRPCRLE